MRHWFVSRSPAELAAFIADLNGAQCVIGRDLGSRGTTLLIDLEYDSQLAQIVEHEASLQPIEHDAPQIEFGGTRPRLQIYSRNAVSWFSVRAWRNESKKVDVARLKGAKAALAQNVVDHAAAEIADQLEKQFGRDSADVVVTHVACGHSKRPDCFACRVARAVAEKLGFTFKKLFRDRPVEGVSHPKEFKKLAPIELAEQPGASLVLVIDDVATSGWHIEEALTTIRQAGSIATGAVWISGAVDN